MKKITSWVLLFTFLGIGAFLTSCKDENDDGNTSKTSYEFSVKAENNPIAAPADGKVYSILVTSTKTVQAGISNVVFEIVSAPEWAPATLDMTALVVDVAKNSSTTARTPGKVVLKQNNSDKILEITITQEGFTNTMTLEESYTTPRCKVLVIEPSITGFDQNPVYEWKFSKKGDEANAVTAFTSRTLSFIQLEEQDYTVVLKITDDSKIEVTQSTTVSISHEATNYSPYLSKVLEYKPAIMDNHGKQFAMGTTTSSALADAESLLKGVDFANTNQGVNLGTLGGYLVFRFDHTVINVEDLCDFRIGSFGTANNYPAPAAVWVAFDKNGNNQPDTDEWYELAGSEYGKQTTRSGVKITYTRPSNFPTSINPGEEIEQYVPYTINDAETGFLPSCNTMFSSGRLIVQWPYWLRESAEGSTMIFSNVTMLPEIYDVPYYPALKNWFKYGYAANSDSRNQTKSSFDIGWAVDKAGKKVNLPGIDFVKVQSALLQSLGTMYGPASTTINSAIDLHLKGLKVSTAAAENDENK